MAKKHIYIATAWPYANGPLHLGHVAALLGADVLARYYRMNHDNVLMVSGSDCHGTPITVEADKQKIAPKKIAEKYHALFVESFIHGLGMSHDLYTTTMTENHAKVVQDIFLKLHKEGFIYPKTVDLPYCVKDGRFLPDRYVEGECPICHYNNARGDQCDECGSMLDPDTLISPRCKLCGTTPEWRPSEHLYLRLSHFQGQIRDWVSHAQGWRVNALHFTRNFLEKETLQDRAITRDTEWGVPIPLPGFESKRIYVWFEAVCGYLSASKEYSHNNGTPALWEEYWKNSASEHYYFLGKDNIPFHAIIWPAILMGYGDLHLPDHIISSEYLTLEKKQFSKSRNWAIELHNFLHDFPPDTLRYYLIANGPETSDADFSWKEFQSRTNKELIANYGNFIHRALSLIANNFPEGIRPYTESSHAEGDTVADAFIKEAHDCFEKVGTSISGGHFREGLRHILSLAEHGNRYINTTAPWEMLKKDKEKAGYYLGVCGHVITCLSTLAYPYIPFSSRTLNTALGISEKEPFNGSGLTWEIPTPHHIVLHDLKPLFSLISDTEVHTQEEKLSQGIANK